MVALIVYEGRIRLEVDKLQSFQIHKQAIHYLRKIGLIYVGANSIMLRSIQLILYKLRYYMLITVSCII